MHYFLTLLLGFAAAAIGLLGPGMLNMTAMRLSLSKGQGAALLFAAGLAVMYSLQVGVAVALSSFVGDPKEVIATLKQWSIALFIILFAVFLYKALTEDEEDEVVDEDDEEEAETGDFFNGMGMALVNFMVIPGFFALVTWFVSDGYMEGDAWSRGVFAAGAGLGAFAVFAAYALLARWLEERVEWVTYNINWILAGIFFILICFRAYKMLA